MQFCTDLRALLLPKAERIFAAILACGVVMGLPAAATQEGWPALYDVTGVASDDVLNIRAGATAASEVIGSYAPDATVEVIRPNDAETWGLVNVREGTGWVAMRFLARRPGQFDGHFPDFAICTGTEPFWSVKRDGDQLTTEMFLTEEPPITETILWEQTTVNHRHRYSFRTANQVGVIARQYCDDGMSDQEFGLELNLILLEEGVHLQGCCRLLPPGE